MSHTIIIAANLNDGRKSGLTGIIATPLNVRRAVGGLNIKRIHITDAARDLSQRTRDRIADEVTVSVLPQPAATRERLFRQLFNYAVGKPKNTRPTGR